MKPQNRSAVPPSVNTNVKSGRRISQLAMTVLAKPNMVMNLKFLRRTCVLPRAIMSLWSAAVPLYLAATAPGTSYFSPSS